MKKTIALTLIICLICLSFGEMGPIFADGPTTFEVSNDFLKYWVNEDNGRFTIETVKGTKNPADNNKQLLFKDGVPDTTFTTFMIDGKQYVYGNEYGFLGLESSFRLDPVTMGNVTKSVWMIKGIEITQFITLDTSDKNAGNVHIRYQVANTGNKDFSIGSRVLLDTMLGENDGSPMSLPGSQTFIENETKFVGAQVPTYWKAVDNQYQTSVVSYGLLSGWRGASSDATQDVYYNQQPSSMVVGHWQGLAETKWDYQVDSTLKFTSEANEYGSADSAVALYWDPQNLAKGKNRIYETYYGLGEYQTKETTDSVQLLVQAPERLEVNDQFNGYTANKMAINGVVDNSLYQAQLLRNAKVTLEYSQGATLPFTQPKTIQLGTVLPNETINFKWTLNTPPLYHWTNFQYKITLNADNLSAPIERSGNVLIPAISGQPPTIKFTDFNNKFIYHLDTDRVITVNGENLNAIVNNGTYRVLLRTQSGGSTVDKVIDPSLLKFEPNQLLIKLPSTETYTVNHDYKLVVEYVKDGLLTFQEFTTPLQFSNDVKYRVRTYGLLGIVRSLKEGSYVYEIITADSESGLKSQLAGRKIVLDVRADKIAKAEGDNIYTVISEKATINSVMTSTYSTGKMNFGSPDRPMKIQVHTKDMMHESPYISVTGSGVLSIPNLNFLYGPYIMTFQQGLFYEISEDDTNKEEVAEEDVNPIRVEFAYGDKTVSTDKAIGTALLGSLPVKIKAAILREDTISFGGSIDFAWLFGMLGDPPWKKETADQKANALKTAALKTTVGNTPTPNPSPNPGAKETKPGENLDVDGALSLSIDDLRFSVYGSNVKLEGIKAEGQIGIPKGVANLIVPGLDIGAGARVAIDTFKNYKFEMEVEVAIKVVEAEGKLILRAFDVGGYAIPIPDKVYVYGGFEPGIPIIPVAPVVFLQGLGGGFEGLFDTITRNFNVLPPLALNATASMSIVKIFVAKKVNLMLSLQRVGLNMASLDIGPVKIFKNLQMGMTFGDSLKSPSAKFSASGEIDVFDVIYGSVMIVLGIDAKHKGALGNLILSGDVKGGIKLPSNWPFVGGMNLGSITAGISDTGVNASASVINIPFKVKYEWSGNFSYQLFSSANHDIGYADPFYSQVVYNENNQPEGTFIVGENINLISDSRKNKLTASLGKNAMLQLAAMNQKNHTFDLNNRDNALIEVLFIGETPVVAVKSPSGDMYPIFMEDQPNQAKNAFVKKNAEGSQHSLFISINSPANGTWTLTSETVVDCKVFEAKNITALESVNTSIVNDDLTIQWTGKEIVAGQTVKVLLVKEVVGQADPQAAEDNLLLVDGIAANALKTTAKLPATQKSGNYKVIVQIMDTDGFVASSMTTQDAFAYTNLNAPQGVQDFKVANVGSGLLKLTWQDPKANLVTGYLVDVFDKSTGEFVTSYEFTEKTGYHLIGGTYKNVDGAGATAITNAMKTASDDSNASDGLVRTVKGIIPGKTYLIKVSAYNTVTEARYYSEISTGEATLNVPNPAIVAHQFLLSSGAQVIDKGIVDSVQTYLTNLRQFTCDLSSNQTVTYQVSINGTEIQDSSNQHINLTLIEGDNAIAISATNENGDTTNHNFKVTLDSTSPVLRIDSPEPGALIKDTVRVRGYSEFNTTITVNGKSVTSDEEGIFVADVSMANQLTQNITVVSTDQAGNRSEFVTEIYNSALSDMVGLVIEPQKNYLILGEITQFKVYLKDSKNQLFQLDPDKVAWKTLVKQGALEVDQLGKVKGAKLGEDILLASYRISKDYAFETGMSLSVVKELPKIKRFYATPEWVTLKLGQKSNLSAYIEMIDGTVSKLDASAVAYRVKAGNNQIVINKDGEISASNVGAGIIEITYDYQGTLFTTEVLVTVEKQTVGKVVDEPEEPEEPEAKKLVTLKDLNVPLGEADRVVLNALKEIISKNGAVTIGFEPLKSTANNQSVKLMVTSSQLETAFEQASFNRDKIKTVILNARFNKLVQSCLFVVPKRFFTGNPNYSVIIRTDYGDVVLKGDLLGDKTISGDETISFMFNQVAWSTLATPGENRDKPMIDFSMMENNQKVDWKSNKKTIKFAIPYTLNIGEDPSKINIWRLNKQGVSELLASGRYSAEDKQVYFETNHLSTFGVSYSKLTFKDLVNAEWSRKAVEALMSKGIIKGQGTGNFNYNGKINRGDFVTLMMRLMYFNEPQTLFFTDVKKDAYYSNAVNAAKELGIISGAANKMFVPTGNITRQDMMVMIDKFLLNAGMSPAEKNTVDLTKFIDGSIVSPYAKTAVSNLIGSGLILVTDGKLRPLDNLTKAEAAVILYRVYNKVYGYQPFVVE